MTPADRRGVAAPGKARRGSRGLPETTQSGAGVGNPGRRSAS